ncbi:3D domain-containing protein [Sporomusa termitida]|uniref:3D domain protein n=1 Tax=Sporomusa termitida TaxID=2377 RepID=A0A517DY98_9FIRM|nr:3D domain-containing protein [Sporomusa termitida]QDR82325.1 3D domain protein [Sporomusa termitida]
MHHKPQRKHSRSLKRRFKRMAAAAAVAGAALVTSALLPGVPATAQASAAPEQAPQPAQATQQMAKTPKGPFNFKSESRVPQKKLAKAQAKAAAAQRSQQAQSKTPVAEQTAKPGPKEAAKQNTKPNTKQTTKKVQASPAADKAPANATKVLDVKATAYAPGAHDNGQWGDKTFLGTTVRPGIVAVDPNVIPLGTRVYIEYPDGTSQYAVAEDTGGAIKGNRIDVAVPSVAKAYDFGIKNVKVHVLGKDA